MDNYVDAAAAGAELVELELFSDEPLDFSLELPDFSLELPESELFSELFSEEPDELVLELFADSRLSVR